MMLESVAIRDGRRRVSLDRRAGSSRTDAQQ